MGILKKQHVWGVLFFLIFSFMCLPHAEAGKVNDKTSSPFHVNRGFCGDGVVQLNRGENCDDHNAVAGDGCSGTCRKEYCGDGTLHPSLGEQCDDGNNLSGDLCSTTCQIERCGDGIVQTNRGEQCDDGNEDRFDGCTNRCQFPLCGDNLCSNSENSILCNQDCPSVCGNGVVEPGEECESITIESCNVDGYPGSRGCLENCSYASCEPSESCGDNTCNGNETNSNCAQDCILPPDTSSGDPRYTCLDGENNDSHQDNLVDSLDPDCSEGNFFEAPQNEIIDGEFMGWVVLIPSPDTRKVYVSSLTGNDNNDGLSPSTPKRTLAAGYNLIRHNFPDWLLLKRGDVWRDQSLVWQRSGRSATEPAVVTTYGDINDPRPRLETTSSAFSSGNTSEVNHIVVDGLELYAYKRDPHSPDYTPDPSMGTPPTGLDWSSKPSRNLTVQDVLIRFFRMGITVQGTADIAPNVVNTKINKCVIVDSYGRTGAPSPATNYHSSGIYATETDGLQIKDSVFDHNGFNEDVLRATSTIFNHNLYLASHNNPIDVRGSIISDASSNGIQMRGGGRIINNAIIRNAISILMVNEGEIRDNVILEAKDINATTLRGTGIDINHIRASGPGLVVSDNIVAHDQTATTNSYALNIDGRPCAGNQTPDNPGCENYNVEVVRNIFYKWYRATLQGVPGVELNNIRIHDNYFQNPNLGGPILIHTSTFDTDEVILQNNIYHNIENPNRQFSLNSTNMSFSSWVSATNDTSHMEELDFPDPQRSVASYAASLGLPATYEAFMAEARQQRKGNWRPEYTSEALNDYIREGFGISP